jgi:hypothetical protein
MALLRHHAAFFVWPHAQHEGRFRPGIAVLLGDWASGRAAGVYPRAARGSVCQGLAAVEPPPEYRKPYEGVLTVIGVPLNDIPSKCKQTPRVLGCARWAKDFTWCIIYIPLNVVDELRDAIYEPQTRALPRLAAPATGGTGGKDGN